MANNASSGFFPLIAQTVSPSRAVRGPFWAESQRPMGVTPSQL